jgi:hypothetical protein
VLHEELASPAPSFHILLRGPQMVPLGSQRHYEIYCHSMLFRGHGYAPWVPEPDISNPDQKGVYICDVLLLREDGGYTYIFNCSLSEDDPKNNGRVPLPFRHFAFPEHPMSLTWNPTFHDRAIISSSETTPTTPSSLPSITSTSPIPYVCLCS